MASFLKAPSVERLPVILEELHSGSLRIPPFQRDFEWIGEQRINLFDSILRGLPTGSLMVWRTELNLHADPALGPYRQVTDTEASQYLLDGRQRMTSLYAALAPALWTRVGLAVPEGTSARAPDGTAWDVLFDLDSEEFELGAPDERRVGQTTEPSCQLPLRLILDDTAFDDWRAENKPTREQVNRARHLRSAFVDYLIPVVPLATDDIGVVTMTFKRVNSGGTEMGDADMTRALAWQEGYDLREKIDGVREALSSLGWGNLEEDTILRAIAGVALADPLSMDVERLAKAIHENSGVVEHAGKCLVEAVKLLGTRLGIRSRATLPTVQILLFAARAFHEAKLTLSEKQQGELAAWAAEASIDERFGTTATHMLRAYFRALVSRLGLSTEQPMTAKRRSAVECWKFRMIWARSRGTALVLAAQRPRDSNGQELPDPHRLLADGNENIGMMLARGGEGLSESLLSSIARLKGIELQSPANRVVCPPAEMPALRRRLLAVDTPPELRESHLIDEVAHRALLRADLGEFFERRRTLILDAEKRWVEERNGSVDIVRDQRTYSQG